MKNKSVLNGVLPTLSAVGGEVPNPDYYGLRSCNATHALGQLVDKNIELSPKTGDGIMNIESFIFKISRYSNLTALTPLTHQVLHFILSKYHDAGFSDVEMIFSFKDYMEERGLKRISEAERQLDNATRQLAAIQIDGEDRYGNLILPFSFCNIIDNATVNRKQYSKTHFRIKLGDGFFSIMKKIGFIRIHRGLQKINTNYHPHAFFLGNSIFRYTYMNRKKVNGRYGTVTTSVKVLMNECPLLDDVAVELASKSRKVESRIVQRFRKELAYLREAGILEKIIYRDANGKELNEYDLEAMHYSEFFKCYVETTAANYPQNMPGKRKRTAKKKMLKS